MENIFDRGRKTGKAALCKLHDIEMSFRRIHTSLTATLCAVLVASACGRAWCDDPAGAAAGNTQAAAPGADAADRTEQVDPLTKLARLLPDDVSKFNAETTAAVKQLVPQIEMGVEEFGFYPLDATPDEILDTVRGLVNIKREVDRLMHATFVRRTEFVKLPAGEPRREAIRSFLACTAALTDLSGRLRYLSFDAINDAAIDLRKPAENREKLIDVLLEGRSSIGAAVMIVALFDPPASGDVARLSDRGKEKLLTLVRETGQNDVMPRLAAFVRQESLSPQIVIA